MGIDIDDGDLRACETTKDFLKADRARFIKLRLHELAARIEQFSGPFQTSLMINCYQYFYFGSKRSRDCYLDHREIFRLLQQVCRGRIVFNNRMELHRVQSVPRRFAKLTGHDQQWYNTEG